MVIVCYHAFKNIPLAIVVLTFVKTLDVLWPRVCAPNRGMGSGSVVFIFSIKR